jgi:L-threonylcarbamoyladenylate synthase
VIAQLGDRIDAVIDLGKTGGMIASTVIDASGTRPMLLREGGISREEIVNRTGIEIV